MRVYFQRIAVAFEEEKMGRRSDKIAIVHAL